jgi:hypothetical protein
MHVSEQPGRWVGVFGKTWSVFTAGSTLAQHASIAAAMDFSKELCLMGLPPDVHVDLDEWAQLDAEARHARLVRRRDDEAMHRLGLYPSFDARARV